jgi:hypothetical protein
MPARDEAQERLQRALDSLNEALAGQRAAVAAWRGALGDLAGAVSGIDDSLRRYRGSLDSLASRFSGLRAQAALLERTADTALAVARR